MINIEKNLNTKKSNINLWHQSERFCANRYIFIFFLPILIFSNINTAHTSYKKFPIYKAEQILNLTLESIKDKYIEEVNIEEISFAGLNGLKTIDKDITIVNDGNRISYYYKAKPIGSFQKPQTQDELEWTRSIIKAVLTIQIKSTKIRNSTPDEIYKAIITSFLKKLDNYSKYITEDEHKIEELAGFGGIGIRYRKLGNFLEITEVIKDLPAFENGIKEKDKITKIENTKIADLTRENIIKSLRGKNGTDLNLTIIRKNKKEEENITLSRKLITPETIKYKIENKTLMIKIVTFNQTTTKTLENLIEEEKTNIDNVIIDIRGNPGGLLEQAVHSANLFLNQGIILSTKGRNPKSNQNYHANGADILNGMPIILLIDGNTASAAEIFAGALLDQERAITIGTTSYGKGSVQTVIPLPNQSDLAITWSHFYTPSGYNLNHLGIMPIICTSNITGNITKDQNDILSNIDFEKISKNITSWRNSTTIDNRDKNHLRNICPAKPQKKLETIFRIAQQVINNQSLYEKLLKFNHNNY